MTSPNFLATPPDLLHSFPYSNFPFSLVGRFIDRRFLPFCGWIKMMDLKFSDYSTSVFMWFSVSLLSIFHSPSCWYSYSFSCSVFFRTVIIFYSNIGLGIIIVLNQSCRIPCRSTLSADFMVINATLDQGKLQMTMPSMGRNIEYMKSVHVLYIE